MAGRANLVGPGDNDDELAPLSAKKLERRWRPAIGGGNGDMGVTAIRSEPIPEMGGGRLVAAAMVGRCKEDVGVELRLVTEDDEPEEDETGTAMAASDRSTFSSMGGRGSSSLSSSSG